MAQHLDLVVASHLRWSFVWQRPQQLLSRLARDRRVLFVEEPVWSDSQSGRGVASLQEVAPNVTVLAPRVRRPEQEATPIWADRENIAAQVRYAMQVLRLERRALWFYTPLPEFLLHTVEPEIVVYDVMDELANFKFAPPGMREQEQRLLRRAEVVFTGGASLYEAKLPLNDNTHLFASGVDEGHYSLACSPETQVPDYVRSIPGPRATYFGVVDERLDYDIIGAMAARRPDVSFMVVGPVVKVDPRDLPQAPNLHYLGQREYAELPRILKGTDVCLMPFARNDATRFISPTKTLEYMATHRPIVSTPIRDVERFYSDIVYLGADAEQFVKQIDVALNESQAERARRRKLEEAVLARSSWDRIAEAMSSLMSDAWAANKRKQAEVAKTVPVRLPARATRAPLRSEPAAPKTTAAATGQ